ncbi:MAG TPA: IS91 family transposase, partial [Dehalococcoidia bacterium]|nr:IS91 family transposase [Dehalococcoidia bacterium]
PFSSPACVLKYLARYTHRVAISNRRLVELQNGRVSFRYKDYSDDQRSKVLPLSSNEFIRRFLMH